MRGDFGAYIDQKRKDRVRGVLRRERVGSQIEDGTGRERSDQKLLRRRESVDGDFGAAFDLFPEFFVFAAQIFKGKQLHPLYFVMTRSNFSPFARG